jgi:hypothetical protein
MPINALPLLGQGVTMSDGGKGSRPRPLSVAQEQYDQRWDLIFGRDKGQKERDFAFDREMDQIDNGQLECNKVLQGMQYDLDRMIAKAESEGPL